MFEYLQDSSQDVAQNIIYSPGERTKGPWLCLTTILLLFSLLALFSFVSAFLSSLIKRIFLLKFSTNKRQAEDLVGGGKDHRILLPFTTGKDSKTLAYR